MIVYQSFLYSERQMVFHFKHFCSRARINLDRSTTIDEYDCYIGIYSPSSNDARPVNVTGSGEIWWDKERKRNTQEGKSLAWYFGHHRDFTEIYGAKSRVLNKFLNAGQQNCRTAFGVGLFIIGKFQLLSCQFVMV